MTQTNLPPADQFKIRCPRLGHQIYFSYCRNENSGQPCFKVLDCWHIHFDVAAYLKGQLTEVQWQRIAQPSVKPKMVSLLDLIEQAKQCNPKSSEES